MRNIGTVFRVFQRQAAQVTLRVDVQERVLVTLAGLDNFRRAKLDVERVGVLEYVIFMKGHAHPSVARQDALATAT